MECPDGGGDDFVGVDDRVSSEEGKSTNVGRVAGAIGLHDGAVQYPRLVGRNTRR